MSVPASVSHWFRLIALGTLLALGAACSGTPLPEPPDLEPPKPEVIVVDVDMSFAGSVFTLEGGPGAVAPETQVWAAVLDRETPPMLVQAAPDGSFSVTVTGLAGEVARLQSRTDGTRSPPTDLLLPEMDAPATPAPSDPCLVLDPAFEVAFPPPAAGDGPAERTLTIRNACGAEVRIESLRLRLGDPAFDIATSAPVSVPDGSTAEVVLRFAPDGSTAPEDLVLLEATLPSGPERRSIFVLGAGS